MLESTYAGYSNWYDSRMPRNVRVRLYGLHYTPVFDFPFVFFFFLSRIYDRLEAELLHLMLVDHKPIE